MSYARKVTLSASSMVQAFPGPQDVVGVRRWGVRCGLPTNQELANLLAGSDTNPSRPELMRGPVYAS
jgi:hypothetical protein